MNLERFQKSPSGRLVRTGSGKESYWAFAPNPLPPELRFTNELIRTLSEADRALGELAGLGRAAPNPHLLIGPFIRREAVLSSRIEGTQADIADLYAYEAGQLHFPGLKPPPPESDLREVLNYVRALEYGLERLKTLPVSLRLIRELHQRLMEGVRGGKTTPGHFRQSQNWLGPPGCTLKESTFVPPPVPEMNAALSTLEKYLHADNSYPPLIRLALIHYQFEAIHPFLDGNGRIGRLLISLLLVHWNLLPLPMLYLSAFFERSRQDYYDTLLAVSKRGAWTDWLLFFLRAVTTQSGEAIKSSRLLQDLQLKWRKRLQSKPRTSAKSLQLADYLFQTPAITMPAVQKILGVTHRWASRVVSRLVEEEILKPVPGRLRNRQFVAQEIIDILSEKQE